MSDFTRAVRKQILALDSFAEEAAKTPPGPPQEVSLREYLGAFPYISPQPPGFWRGRASPAGPLPRPCQAGPSRGEPRSRRGIPPAPAAARWRRRAASACAGPRRHRGERPPRGRERWARAGPGPEGNPGAWAAAPAQPSGALLLPRPLAPPPRPTASPCAAALPNGSWTKGLSGKNGVLKAGATAPRASRRELKPGHRPGEHLPGPPCFLTGFFVGALLREPSRALLRGRGLASPLSGRTTASGPGRPRSDPRRLALTLPAGFVARCPSVSGSRGMKSNVINYYFYTLFMDG